ncbi:MAG: hypothetical protein IKQ83_08680 [Lachnospiraceae bacterium]|nr:hypothetical protein [Lachnospiraceae bacterium]
MVYVQLGFISKCVDYVLDHILTPAFEKLMEIITYVHKTVFSKILEPLLSRIFGAQIEFFKSLLIRYFSELFYRLEVTVLKILTAMEDAFRMFAGLEPVYYKGEKKGSLLLAVFQSPYFIRALILLTFLGILLSFLFALIGTVKGMADLEGKKPVSKVMRYMARSLLTLVLVPIMSLFFVVLGDAILKQVDTATRPGSGKLADAIFAISTLDAVKEEISDSALYNSSTRPVALKTTASGTASDFGILDKYRGRFYEGGKKLWGSSTEVMKFFDVKRIDYIVGIGGGMLYIYLIGTSCIVVICRIFDLLTLLIVSPFFASTMPIDDGERYKKWMDTFLAKLVSGYGLIIGMNVYLGITTIIIKGDIKFFGEGTTESIDYLVRLLFMAVGAYAVTQAGPIVTTIMNVQAGRMEGQAIARCSGIMATPVNALTGVIGKGVSNILGRAWNNISGKGNHKGQDVPGVTDAGMKDGSNAFGQGWNNNTAYAGGGNAFDGKRPSGHAYSDAVYEDISKTVDIYNKDLAQKSGTAAGAGAGKPKSKTGMADLISAGVGDSMADTLGIEQGDALDEALGLNKGDTMSEMLGADVETEIEGIENLL